MDANVVAVAFSGREACMDFYYTSPQVIAAVQKGGEFQSSPQVRVILTSRQLMAVYDELLKQKNSIPLDVVNEFNEAKLEGNHD